jgi:hypothetical protein
MVPNPDQEVDQDWILAHLSGQHKSLMRYIARKFREFLIVLRTSLKQLGQRIMPKHPPTKQRSSWSQSPHH